MTSPQRLGAMGIPPGLITPALRGMVTKTGQCEKHGQFFATVPERVEISCPECRDEKAERQALDAAMSRRIAQIVANVGVPARFRESGFRDWVAPTPEAEAVKQAVMGAYRELREAPKQWRPLWLSGTPGTGKTHLLCALANNLAQAGVSARYATLQGVLGDIKSAYRDDTKTEAGQIARYVRDFDVLVLDEIDVMRGTDNDKTLLFEVINGRYNALSPVVIASNQPPEKLADFVTDRVADRLRENALTLRCDWPSARTAL